MIYRPEFLRWIETGPKGCSVDMFIQLSEFFHVSQDALILGMKPDKSQETEHKMRLKANVTELIDQLAQLKAQAYSIGRRAASPGLEGNPTSVFENLLL